MVRRDVEGKDPPQLLMVIAVLGDPTIALRRQGVEIFNQFIPVQTRVGAVAHMGAVGGAATEGAGCCSYHSTVLRRPSSNDVRAEKPISRRAFSTFKQRRGWPSGCDGSQRISPEKFVSRAIRATSSRIEISRPDPKFTGSVLL